MTTLKTAANRRRLEVVYKNKIHTNKMIIYYFSLAIFLFIVNMSK